MTKDIETDNAGERAAVTLSAMKMILKWHPEGTAKSLRNAGSIPPVFGFITVDICVQHANFSNVYGGGAVSAGKVYEAAEEIETLRAYRMNPPRCVFITADNVEETRQYFTPESAAFITEGSILYNIDFQAWGSVETTDPAAFLEYSIRDCLEEPSIRDYHLMPFTPGNQHGKDDRGLILIASLNVEQDDAVFARIAQQAEALTFWDSISFSYQSTPGAASIGIMQFRINPERLEARLKEYAAALRAYRRRTK